MIKRLMMLPADLDQFTYTIVGQHPLKRLVSNEEPVIATDTGQHNDFTPNGCDDPGWGHDNLSVFPRRFVSRNSGNVRLLFCFCNRRTVARWRRRGMLKRRLNARLGGRLLRNRGWRRCERLGLENRVCSDRLTDLVEPTCIGSRSTRCQQLCTATSKNTAARRINCWNADLSATRLQHYQHGQDASDAPPDSVVRLAGFELLSHDLPIHRSVNANRWRVPTTAKTYHTVW